MYRFKTLQRAAVGALAGFAAISSAHAQTPMRPAAPAMTGHESADSAQALVNFITTVNRDEIALGRLAMMKASNADVKAYAQRLVDDHTNVMSAWAQKVPAQSLTIPDSGKSAAKPMQNMAGSAAMANGVSEVKDTTTKSKGGVGPAALHSANMSALEELQKLDGAAFDAKYIQTQMESQDAILKELTLRPVTYTDLQTLLTNFRTTIENHQVAARKLRGAP